jgi:signal transduction histidine kinase
LDNGGFLGNREPVEVYLNANNAIVGGGNPGANNALNYSRGQANQSSFAFNNATANSAAEAPTRQQQQLKPSGQPATLAGNNSPSRRGGGGGGFGGGANNSSRNLPAQSDSPAISFYADSISSNAQQKQELATAKGLSAPTPVATLPSQQLAFDETAAKKDAASQPQTQNALNYKTAQTRKVSPQSQIYQAPERTKTEAGADEPQNNLSKAIPAEAEFRQLIGEQTDGMLARFLQNKLKLMFWHRLGAEPDLIFGAELNLNRVVDGLRGLVQPDRELQNEICVAVLDDNAKPVVVSREKFQANWKRPFVATEIGDALPHWEVAAYLINPAALTKTAHTTRLTLGLLIAVLVLAIGVGSWLIVRSLNAELKLARQKTDFVSNVSHELKTPLTSIRMFSELLAEGRVADAAKQRSYLQIITAEAGRLTRLINNVLDFSRMERGEKKYNFQPCDLAAVVRGIEQTFRPHLEAGGFKFVCELPDMPVPVRGDADALSQVIVNLLSNAEKYSSGSAGILPASSPLPTRRQDAGAPGKEITLQLAQRQSPLPHAEIKVLDRGAGIPRGSEEKIFEKFYRAHDSLSSGVQGSGLGLTIARQIARAHGGDVAYEPREGGGSCFILRLPISTTDGQV